MVAKYKNVAATGQIYSGATQLYGVVLTAGSDTATVVVKDGTSTAGAIVAKLSAVANTTASIVLDCFPIGITSGIYLTITGTTPSVSVFSDGFYSSTSTSSSTSTTTTSTSTTTTSTSTTTTSTSTTSTSTSTTTINEETP